MGFGNFGQFGQNVPPIPAAAAAPAGIRPGQMPGQIEINGELVEVKDWTDRPIYDTELLVTPVAAGAEVNFFRTLTWPAGPRKNRIYTNMTVPNQLPAGWFARVYGISFHVLQQEVAGAGIPTTAEDVQRILYNGFFQLLTSSDKVETEGTLIMFPSPYGLSGPMQFEGGALHEMSNLNNGVASKGALPHISPYLDLVNEMVVEGRVTFPDGLVLDNNCRLQLVLNTWTAKPVR